MKTGDDVRSYASELTLRHQAFIDGKLVASALGETFDDEEEAVQIANDINYGLTISH